MEACKYRLHVLATPLAWGSKRDARKEQRQKQFKKTHPPRLSPRDRDCDHDHEARARLREEL